MISVQNHQRLLNGNNLVFFCFSIVFFIQACSPKTGKPIQKPQLAKQPKLDSIDENQVITPVDTMVWTDISPAKDPITDTSPKSSPQVKNSKVSSRSIKKEKYNIKLLIPLNSANYQTASLSANRFVQFYSGALLAREDLQKLGVSMNIQVEDTADPDFDVKTVWEEGEFGAWDMVIGPFEREDVKTAASEAMKRKTTLISPWQTSTKITKENEYYIQLKPNLKEHFHKLVEHACREFGPNHIVVITHDNPEGKSWFQFMENVSKEITGIDNYIRHFPVTEDSLVSPNTAFVNLFAENPPSAIILPYYSFADEEKIYAVIRRLNIDKGVTPITVYGMPLMIDSDKIDFEYYSSLHCRIAMSDFVDDNQYKVKQFKRRYFETYGQLADAEALKGYDVLMFAGKNIKEYGNFFQELISGESQKYLQTEIKLEPVFSEETTENPSNVIEYYENKKIWIIEFKSAGFEVID